MNDLIPVECRSCGERYRVDPYEDGPSIRCDCGDVIRVPRAGGRRTARRLSRNPPPRWPWIVAPIVVVVLGFVAAGIVALSMRAAKRDDSIPVGPGPQPTSERPQAIITRVSPPSPQVGDTLRVFLYATDRKRNPLVFFYRTDPADEWNRIQGNIIVLSDLKQGILKLEIKSQNPQGMESVVLHQQWNVRRKITRPIRPGGPGQKISEVKTDNNNTLLSRYRRKCKITASSHWANLGPSLLIDGIFGTSWFSANGDSVAAGKSPWVEIRFPEDVSVRRVSIFGNRHSSWRKGYAILKGRLTLSDADGKVLKSVEAKAQGEFGDFEFAWPDGIEGVRSIRFTSLEDQGDKNGFGDVALGEIRIE